MKTIDGVVHGKTIQLSAETGLPEGQHVAVTLAPLSSVGSPSDDAARESLRSAAGTWSDDAPGLERYLQWNRDQRKQAGRGAAE